MKTIDKVFAETIRLLTSSKICTTATVAKIATGITVVALISEAFATLIEPTDRESATMDELEPEENLEAKAEENKARGMVPRLS